MVINILDNHESTVNLLPNPSPRAKRKLPVFLKLRGLGKNWTTDAEIVARAVSDGRVVVSKDSDFLGNYLLTGMPRLLLISTGNISNSDLEQLVRANLASITAAFEENHWVEMTRETLVIHE